MSVKAFTEIYSGAFTRYLTISRSLGGDIYQQSELVNNVFQTEMSFLEAMCKFKQPVHTHDQDFLIETLQRQIQFVQNFRNENGSSPCISYLILVSESVKILEWVVKPDPINFINDVKRSVNIYEEEILDNNENQTDENLNWVNTWTETLERISHYVMKYHSKGLAWIGLMLPSPVLLGDIPFVNRRFDHLALFQEINKGENIMRILRQTNLEDSGASNSTKLSKYSTSVRKTTEIFEQSGNRWRIEHKKGDHNNLIIQTAEIDNVIYVYNCVDCTILIENTVNIIRIDNCRKICIIFKTVLSEIELVDCKDVKIHIFATIPSVKINSCQDVKLFITHRALNVVIYTNLSSNVSVLFPFNDGVHRAFAVPQLLATTIDPNRGLQTTVIK